MERASTRFKKAPKTKADKIAELAPPFRGDQEVAYASLRAYLQSKTVEGPFVLRGYAGTGKTFLIARAILEFYKLSPHVNTNPFATANQLTDNIIACAPTNKAVSVLSQTLQTTIPGMLKFPTCRTIYSLLGITFTPDDNADTESLKFPEHPVELSPELEIIFVDEASMINRQLLAYIIDFYPDHKWVFSGDPAQLPPVGEKISPIWEMGFDLEMKQIVRFDNTIINLATHIRTELENPRVVVGSIKLNHDPDPSGHTGVLKLSQSDFREHIESACEHGFFLKRDHTRVVCWRNRAVASYNDLIRRHLWDDAKHQWVVGEPFTFSNPYFSVVSAEEVSEAPVLTTDSEGIISNIRKLKSHPYCKGLPTWEISALVYDSYGKEVELIFHIIPKKGEEVYADMLRERAALAKSANSKLERQRLWKRFWWLKRCVGQIRYTYAITAHRSQGSTYQNVFVDNRDILANPTDREAISCLYVAITRAKSRVFLLD